jgi:hypothetical protein
MQSEDCNDRCAHTEHSPLPAGVPSESAFYLILPLETISLIDLHEQHRDRHACWGRSCWRSGRPHPLDMGAPAGYRAAFTLIDPNPSLRLNEGRRRFFAGPRRNFFVPPPVARPM